MIGKYLAVGLLAALSGMAMAAEKSEVYEQFNAFAAQHFGASREPLIYEHFGSDLKLLEAGTWQHVSENSAVLAFSTSLPATSHIEYGRGNAFDQKTDPTDRPFYQHIHHLRGLEIGQTYHYRFVAVDEKRSRHVLHEGSFVTRPIENAIHIPGDVKGPPYNLTKGNATYVLTEDIIADSTAINIMAPNITLDLNGHTVTYDNDGTAPLGEEKGFGHFGEQNPHGVRSSYSGRGSRIINGFIVQGKGQRGAGSQPIFRASEVAGVSITYGGEQVTGITGVEYVHHNVITDVGTRITDRHMGIDAIQSPSRAHHNLIKRARHRGMRGVSGGEYTNNEVYVDSYATNSFALMLYKTTRVTVRDNRFFGTGYHALGVGTVSAGVGDITVENNLIHLEALPPLARSAEYGQQSEVACVRVTWGGENITYANNLMIANAEPGGEASAIWHYSQNQGQKDVVYRDNTIKVMRKDDRVSDKLEGAIRICGTGDNQVPVLLQNNTVISNFCHVRLGDGYGVGRNAQFVDNTFIRVGDHQHYATIRIGFNKKPSDGHVFKGTRFEGGAGFDKVQWVSSGPRAFTVIDETGKETVYARD